MKMAEEFTGPMIMIFIPTFHFNIKPMEKF